jgi:hypothetical protein
MYSVFFMVYRSSIEFTYFSYQDQIMNNKSYTLINIAGLTALFFVIIGLFFQPGEIDLITPSHSDGYLYLTMANDQWFPARWLSPRPLLYVYLHLIGLIHQLDIFFLLLTLPAFCFLTLLLSLVMKAGLSKQHLLPIAAFFFVSFGSPLFYPHFQLDVGGMLGACFAVLAINSALNAIKEKEGDSVYWWFMPIFFTLLSIESKPNYSFLLLSLAFIGALLVRGYRSKGIFVGVLSVICWVFIKDKLLGSPFLVSSETVSPYAVIIDPVKNIQALGFYIKNSFTTPLVWVCLLASIILLAHREWKLFSLFVILTLSASMPMALLVNRLWDTYAWYSTVIIGVLIMVAVSRLLDTINKKLNTFNKVLAITALFLISIGLMAHAFTQSHTMNWTLTNQHYNRNLMSALNRINTQGERKILLVGIHGPYHPLRNSVFMRQAFPNLGNFKVLLRKDELFWNDNIKKTKGIYLEEVNWADYSAIYSFDNDGRTVTRLTPDEIAKMPNDLRIVFLYCDQNIDMKSHDATQVAQIIECLNNNNEYDAAISIGTSVGDIGKNQPWLYYHLAKSFQMKGSPITADELLNKALKLEPKNPLFLNALSKNKAEKNK